MIISNSWSSITVLTKALIADFKSKNPGVEIEYCDWDTHANLNELPNADLVGPTALAVTEQSRDLVQVSFAIGVSTYLTDTNLFRQRSYISQIFERLRQGETITYFDAEKASEKSVLVVTDGTTAVPMSKSEARPWQYVQCECLLVPSN